MISYLYLENNKVCERENPILRAQTKKTKRIAVHENVRKMPAKCNCVYDDERYYKKDVTNPSLAPGNEKRPTSSRTSGGLSIRYKPKSMAPGRV